VRIGIWRFTRNPVEQNLVARQVIVYYLVDLTTHAVV